MTSEYKILLFRPKILSTHNYNDILWKADVKAPTNLKSIIINLIQDNISVNNRRTLESWVSFLNDNMLNFLITENSKYFKSYEIDDNNIKFDLDLYACDVNAFNYFVEISPEFILPILFILDLQKNGTIFPNVLKKKIENAKETLKYNADNNSGRIQTSDNTYILSILNQIDKLVNICRSYECDIEFHIIDR